MIKPLRFLALVLCAATLGPSPVYTQTTARPAAEPPPTAVAGRGIDLASKGQCSEALPVLKRATPRLTDKQVKYRAEMAIAKCAMSLGQDETAVQALFTLRREFPHDPQALYISTHFLSELGNRAAQELATTAPGSYQAHELEAEAFESQGRWAEAAAEYQKILDQDPTVPGIHYRIGRVAISRGESVSNTEEARKEFEQELKIDPSNAAAEFSLGEIYRRAGQWDDAVAHFSSAATIDSGFAEAYLAMGMSLVAEQKFAEAVSPLQKYVKLVPGDPAGHYQLAVSYNRTGRKEDAARELQLQRETAAKAPNGGAPQQ